MTDSPDNPHETTHFQLGRPVLTFALFPGLVFVGGWSNVQGDSMVMGNILGAAYGYGSSRVTAGSVFSLYP